MDYSSLIHTIVDPFITSPENLLIKNITSDDGKADLTFLICADNNDIARLIGKKGVVANAIRDIVSIAGKLENKKVRIKFESFDEENKEEGK